MIHSLANSYSRAEPQSATVPRADPCFIQPGIFSKPIVKRIANVQAYDLIMLIVLGMATIFGAIKGFAWQVASLASILVSYVVSYRYRFDVAEMIEAKPPWNQFLAMLILYIGTSFVIWVGFRLVSGMIDKVRLKEFDRHLGAAFGLAKGVIFCLLITMFAMSLLGPNQQAAICQSRSGYYIAIALDRGVGILPQEIHDVVGPHLAKLDDQLKRGGSGSPDLAGEGGLLPGFPSITGGENLAIPGLPGSGTGLSNMPNNGLPNNGLPSVGLPGTGGNFGAPAGEWDWRQGADALSNANESLRQFGDAFDSLNGAGTGTGILPPQNFPPLDSAPVFNPGAPFNSGANGLRSNNGLRPSGDAQQAQQPSGQYLPRY